MLGSVGLDARALKPLTVVLDTGSAVNVIRQDALPSGWERYRLTPSALPTLADANGKPIAIASSVNLTMGLGSRRTRETFFVAPNLVVPVLLSTSYLDANVQDIRCRKGLVEIHKGGTIALLARKQSPHLREQRSPFETKNPDQSSHKVRLARGICIPPRT